MSEHWPWFWTAITGLGLIIIDWAMGNCFPTTKKWAKIGLWVGATIFLIGCGGLLYPIFKPTQILPEKLAKITIKEKEIYPSIKYGSVNAPNSQIVTQGQTGGINTVNITVAPKRQVKYGYYEPQATANAQKALEENG